VVARRLLACAALFSALSSLPTFVATITAQGNRPGGVTPLLPPPDDHLPPQVAVLLPSPRVVTTATPQIRIDWCDDYSLNANSRLIKVNGATVTSSFDYVTAAGGDCGVGAHKRSTSTTVTLNPGTNSLYAYICDNSGNCGSVTDSIIYSAPPALTLVAPTANGGNGRAIVHNRWPLVQATYSAATGIDSTSVVLQIRGVDMTSLARHNRSVLEWEVDSAHQLSPGDTADIYVRACDIYGTCSSITRRTVLDNSGPPIVSFAGMPLEALGRQAVASLGPGISISGADVETGFAVPSYVSMNAPRSTGLVYSTRTSHPRALVNADIELTWPAGTPDQIKAVLIDGGVRMDSVVVSSPDCSASTGRQCRVGLQADFAGATYSSPTRKWLTVEVTVTSSGVPKVSTDSVEVVLVDRRTSRYGDGWAVAGVLQRVAAGNDQLVVAPNGQASIYRGSGGYFISPPGDFGVLVNTGSQYELRFRDGSKLVFNGNGWESQAVDRNGNTTTVAYSGVGQVDSITDPTSHAFTFGYDGNGKLSTITDPGSRVVRVTINGSNYLAQDSLGSGAPTPVVATYGYTSTGSNGAIVLATRADALGQTTTVGYSGRYRPTQATLPAVLPETGSWLQSPVVGYAPQETAALGSLISADSVFAKATDPLGHWAKSALSRWGAAVKTWDALGTLGRASYTPEGFVAWAEGKVADSTRVYNTYDGLGRLVRTYRWRSQGVMVRLDSLAYDASHNVVQQVDARGKVSRFGYDTHHNVLWAATPNNDTTRTWYGATGLPDSTRAPGETAHVGYSYDATWKNLSSTTDEEGTLAATNTFDSYGRTTEARARVMVKLSGASDSTFQWRRRVTSYDVANQTDSTRFQRTDNCTPCTSPPTWPSASDSAKSHLVRWVHTRLGLDSLRYDARGYATRYAYDALGRLRARWPHTTVAEVDSFRYDLAGNLRYQWTRRGYQIAHYYDGRNRDTTTTVPGIGDFKRRYNGPNDELNRLWVSGYSDPIGGVDPEVFWGYSQAGLLLADTAGARYVTSYRYDFFGRDSVVTDVVGTWAYRYEANRGMLDSILTPVGDTVRYTFSTRGQVRGPWLRSGSDGFSRVPLYIRGSLWELENDAAAYMPADLTNASMEGAIGLLPVWTEQQGGGGPTVTMQDSLTQDGWLRLLRARYLKDGAALAVDSFSYDVAGNITPAGESRSYDAATNRLTARGGDSYGYDAAGDLTSWSQAGGCAWSYTYDALDRLVAVSCGGALVARYAYDVLGRRIVKRVYSGSNAGYLRMIYRGGEVTAETDSAGNALTLSYTWGLAGDDLLAVHRHSDGAHWYVVQDQRHSVRGLVDRDGSATWRVSWRYRAYGAALDSAGTAPVALRYRWIGREYDVETGFYYARARYYDPVVQRFVQEDPSGFASSSNLYAYGNGGPTGGRDLSGMKSQWDEYISDDVYNMLYRMGCWSEDCSGSNGGGSDWMTANGAITAEHDDILRNQPPPDEPALMASPDGNLEACPILECVKTAYQLLKHLSVPVVLTALELMTGGPGPGGPGGSVQSWHEDTRIEAEDRRRSSPGAAPPAQSVWTTVITGLVSYSLLFVLVF
jgi:RHS repeat-associated protein